jgi:outer membrane receptor protein involved in Fe transport
MDLPNTLVGLYWQDTFKVGNSLTLVYGLRYDYDGQPQGITRDPNNPVEAPLQTGINRDKNNLAPRLGVTYDPFGDGRTVIRGGYGKFYDKIFLLVARNALIARQSVSR